MTTQACQLETRDYEIMRTLVRVRFLRYGQLGAAFFSSGQAARRRLQKLQGRDLIERHTKGAPPGSNDGAWRITQAGIAELHGHLPNEPVPENLEERLLRQSLVDHHHREELATLYLRLVVGSERPTASTNGAIRKWTAQVRGRAEQIDWQPDGEVTLLAPGVAHHHRIVPDATASPKGKSRRLFIELDRSTKVLSSIEGTLEHYAAFIKSSYARTYADQKTPWVVYVARTEARRKGIARLAERIVGGAGLRWKALVFDDDAIDWLAPALLEETVAPLQARPERHDLRTVADNLLSATDALLRNGSALFDELEQESPEVVAPWRRALAAVYDVLHGPTEQDHAG